MIVPVLCRLIRVITITVRFEQRQQVFIRRNANRGEAHVSLDRVDFGDIDIVASAKALKIESNGVGMIVRFVMRLFFMHLFGVFVTVMAHRNTGRSLNDHGAGRDRIDGLEQRLLEPAAGYEDQVRIA